MTIKKMKKHLFGTNGVRGVVGKEITPDLALKIGKVLGYMRPGTIALGRDTRTSGSTLAGALKAGLLAMGCNVVDCGILPTPALQYIVKEHYDGGAMITASHNPPEYNGIKIIEPDGTEMGDQETITLEKHLSKDQLSLKPWDAVGQEISAPYLISEYVQAIVSKFPDKPGTGMTVVVDPGSGPACQTTPLILQGLGCRVLTINAIMDGKFPGRMPEPSPDGLKGLSALVVANNAAFGVAHDGDADRAVFVDETGKYVEENQEFAAIAGHICDKVQGTIVTPVSSSDMVELVAKDRGSSVKYTPVGSIYVARTMRELLDQGERVIFGGEGNGGLIFPEHQFCRDGGMTAAMMVQLLAKNKQTLSQVIAGLPARYMIKEKLAIPRGVDIIEKLIERYKHDNIDLTDGIKIRRDNSWVLIRASGTEPLIRIIIDSDNEKNAISLLLVIKTELKKLNID
jgi:phosphomannomutase/phosphoglucomutase